MNARVEWADPGHWAVFAFATTSFMLGFVNANWIGNTGNVFIVLPVALIFGGLVQLLVAMLECFRGNTFGMCVFGTYGPFWIIYGLYVAFFASGTAATEPKSAGTDVALFLAMFAVLSFFFTIASLRTDAVLVAIFALIVVALALLAYGNASPSNTAIHIGGYVTIAFAVLAWYHALAGLLDGTFGRKLLPVGYIGPLTLNTTSPDQAELGTEGARI